MGNWMNRKTFRDGYVAGWKSVAGARTIGPRIVPETFSVPAGKTEYEHGFEQGKQDARRAKKRI